jgi:hypothetical protein
MKNIVVIVVMALLISLASIYCVSALSVVVHVPEKYTTVQPGERFYFEIEIKYPENPQRKDLKLEYEILTKDKEVIAQSKVLKAVETQASFMDFIVIPETAKKGMHIIKIKIADYETLSEDVEASFQVVAGSESQIKLYFFILLGIIIIIGILVVVTIVLERKAISNSERARKP